MNEKAMRFEKLAAEYDCDATIGYAYDFVRKDGSHANPNAERSRQTALLLREAASELTALPPLRAREEIAEARYIPDLVKNAMLTAWNEICSDTGCHPTDIERNFEGRRGHLGFTPAHWAQMAGDIVAAQIAILSSAAGQEWRDINSAPSYSRPEDRVWVIGGRYTKPAIVVPDGEYWRATRGELKFLPTHWAPCNPPPLPAPPVAESLPAGVDREPEYLKQRREHPDE